MTDFRKADISKQESYDLLRDWIKLVARHTNPDQDISELLGWLWKLKPATPDPTTGLVPCGCGGKAEIVKTYDENSWTNIVHVACKKCKIHITFTAPAELRGTDALKEDAKAAWNRAMGYKEQ